MSFPGVSPDRSLTFLFTDVEDSTGHWQRLPDVIRSAMEQHDALLRTAIHTERGHIFRTAGDAFYVSFEDAAAALRSALEAQRTLHQHFGRPESRFTLRVRMALHTGMVQFRDGDYFGLAPAGAARLLEVAQGGQILLTNDTILAANQELPEGAVLADLGERTLRSFTTPLRLWQLSHAELPASFPPPRNTHTPNNLPRMLTPFIGRARELGEIRHRILTTPLVTLLGAGGCGKTRIATQVCDYLFSTFPDGIWFIDLLSITDADHVPQFLADTIGLRCQASDDITEQLIQHLATKRVLMLWDNCEHLLSALVPLATRLLLGVPTLHLLATSREPLGVAGEICIAVPPLDLPPGPKIIAPADALQFDSVRLFVERLTAAKPTFRLTETSVTLVVEICQYLEGIPLALVIVAAWGNALSLEQMAKRIREPFRLLKASGPHGPVSHHQTLRAAIDWSYALLSEAEQVLLQRTGLFVGGWTMEAVEEICAAPPIEDVMDSLLALVRKSLVQFEDNEQGGRYRLLDTIRHYATEQLERRDEYPTLKEDHRRYYLQWVQETAPAFYSTDAVNAMARTDAELANIRKALAETTDVTTGRRFIASLFWYWHTRGYLHDGKQWITRFLDIETDIQPDEKATVARALNGAGILNWGLNELVAARSYFTRSLELQRELGNHEAAAGCLSNLGSIAVHLGDTASARSYLGESLAHFITTGNVARQAAVLVNLGVNAEQEGNVEDASGFFERAVALQRPLGPSSSLATTLHNLANNYVVLKRPQDALPLFLESLRLHRDLDHRIGIANLLDKLPLLLDSMQQPEQAALLLGVADAYHAHSEIPKSPTDQQELIGLRQRLVTHLGEKTVTEKEIAGRKADIDTVIRQTLHQGEDNEQ